MALWGTVMVNTTEIADWSAQRIDNLEDLDQVSLYHCRYRAVPLYPGADEVWAEATIAHRYSDGAAVLAGLVLQLAEGGWHD